MGQIMKALHFIKEDQMFRSAMKSREEGVMRFLIQILTSQKNFPSKESLLRTPSNTFLSLANCILCLNKFMVFHTHWCLSYLIHFIPLLIPPSGLFLYPIFIPNKLCNGQNILIYNFTEYNIRVRKAFGES
jgi:hypothetical protein